MVEIRESILVKEAVEKVMAYRKIGESEYISFHECDNRRLAEDIVAKHNIPTFNKSPYDGFAFRSKDTENATETNPATFEIIEHIGAGELPTKTIEQGQAIRIMTGAKIPNGADCVAMFEDCKAYEENEKQFMSIAHQVVSGDNIMEEGSEVREGDKLIESGTLICPGVKASLATFGYAQVKVAKKPVVGVIATGTELLDVHEELEPGKIRNSNAYMVGAQVERAGGEVIHLGKLADDLEPSYKMIKESLDKVDMLITTGGVSVGDFDLLPAIYEKLGAEVLFNKIEMRPGSVTTVAKLGEKLLFGLSGNPSACFVGFELFARPIIQHFLFNKKPYLKRITAILDDEFPKANPFTRFVRTYITYDGDSVKVKLAGLDKSNAVTSLAHTTTLMVLPGGTKGYTAGSEVDVLLLEDKEGQDKF